MVEDDDLIEKYNAIWDKVSADIQKKKIASLSTIKKFLKPKYLMVMKLQIFMIKKFLR